MFAASEAHLKQVRAAMSVQTIGHDKLNQLRHVRIFREEGSLHRRMMEHGAVIGRKFKILLSVLERDLADTGVAEWTSPRGGYFSSLNVPDGCAARVYGLCKEAGVVLTKVGATYPYGLDPRDRNLRLAPSFAKDADLQKAAEVLTVAVRMAALEKLLAE
jgi:DNA-binding transcriptional MocR family regulator